MRLRFFHLQNYPPISDAKVCFASGSPLARDCAIRFVVGVNGSGKSNFLRAIAEVFLALADLRVPAFPVSVVYELGERGTKNHRTLLLHSPGGRHKASLWIRDDFSFDDHAEHRVFESCLAQIDRAEAPGASGFTPLIAPGDWPLRDSTPPSRAMPSAVIAYTTGDPRPWKSIWARNQDASDLPQTEEEQQNEERPAGWTEAQERVYQALQLKQQEKQEAPGFSEKLNLSRDLFQRPVLLDATLLKCALLALVLPTHLRSRQRNSANGADADPGGVWAELVKNGGWHQLETVVFRSHLQPDRWSEQQCKVAHDWWLCASDVLAEPNPLEQRRSLFFDVGEPFSVQDLPTLIDKSALEGCATRGQALCALLGEGNPSPWGIFTGLLNQRQAGLFDEVQLRLRRGPVPGLKSKAALQDVGVMRYEELSDGEQMYLGRMALMHLLRGKQDALLLLDEPETHFNDVWKRELVSIIDDALAKTSAEVLIATHSALMLTDALRDELVVLGRSASSSGAHESRSTVRELAWDVQTFGATGDHPLRDVFGAPDTVGRRASRLFEVLIASADFAQELELCWQRNTAPSTKLVKKILKVASETEAGLTVQSVTEYLESINKFAQHYGAGELLTMRNVLESFIRNMGPGYFQVDLKQAWRRTVEGAPNAA